MPEDEPCRPRHSDPLSHAPSFSSTPRSCNEAGCGDGSLLNDTVVRAKAAIYAVDGTRSVTGNMGYTSPVTPGTLMSTMLDVMGMSHVSAEALLTWHEQVRPYRIPITYAHKQGLTHTHGHDATPPYNRNPGRPWS